MNTTTIDNLVKAAKECWNVADKTNAKADGAYVKVLWEDFAALMTTIHNLNKSLTAYEQEQAKATDPLMKTAEHFRKRYDETLEINQHLLKRIEELENVVVAKNITIDELIDALKELCDLKEIKDNIGVNADYNNRKPEAWKQARSVLNRLIGYGEPTEGDEWSGGFADNH